MRYNAQSGTGEIRWTLIMKNGDSVPNFAGGLTIAGGEATCTGLRFEGNGGTGITANGHILMKVSEGLL